MESSLNGPMRAEKNKALRGGFTLVELLVVMSILAILGGLGVFGFNQVKDRSNYSRAETQIQMLESSLTSYELDNGYYPVAGKDPLSSTNILFKELGGYDENGNSLPDAKVYANFIDPNGSGRKLIESETGKAAPQWTLKDPWGNPYRYQDADSSRGEQKDNEYATYNPTFDLWSIGKDEEDNSVSPAEKAVETTDDIRNW